MTLKTSLIITGDSTGGVQAVDALADEFDRLKLSVGAAAPALDAVAAAQDNVAAGGRTVADAVSAGDKAQAGAASSARDFGKAQDEASAAIARAAAEARTLATATGVLANTPDTGALSASVEKLGVSATGAAETVRGLDAAQTAAAASGTGVAGALERAAAAQAEAAASARDLSTSIDGGATANGAMATAAAEAATANTALSTTIVEVAEKQRQLIDQDGDAASAVAVTAKELGGLQQAHVDAGKSADAQAAASAALQGEIGKIIAQITGGASVFEAMAEHGNGVAAALQQIADVSGTAGAAIGETGKSGEAAGVDIGGLGEAVVGVAEKVENTGTKFGAVAGFLAGPWGAAISIATSLLIPFVSGLIEGAQESDSLATASLSLAEAMTAEQFATDAARKAIEDYNKQAEQQRRQTVLQEQATLANVSARLQEASATREATAALVAHLRQQTQNPNLAVGSIPGGGSNFLAGVNLGKAQQDLREQDKGIAGAQQARRELLIKEAGRTAAAAVDPIARINQQFDRMKEQAVDLAAKSTKAAEGLAKELTGVEKLRKVALAAQRALDSPPKVDTPKPPRQHAAASSTRDTAADAAADAQRQLARDLEQVTSRYLPATAAAKAYADALASIDRLAKAYDPKTGSGLSPELADQARAAAAAARDKRLADLAMTPEIKAANDAKKSIDGVIASLAAETAARQTLDPVQQQMAKHQAELAKLTGEERTQREAALTGYYAQAEATKAVEKATRAAAEAQRALRDLALSAFDAIVLRGEKAGDVVKRLAQSIASAAVEATLFGTGPLAARLKGPIAQPMPGGTSPTQSATGIATADLAQKIGKSVGTSVERVLGKGSTGRLLQNAGLGYTAAGITGGNGIGGAIGGAAGGELAGKFLSKALGSFAGPLGSIAGGILGGVIGKLFGGAKTTGSSAIQIVGGQFQAGAATGGSAQLQQQATGLAGKVVDSLGQIASQLGGTAGTVNGITIGYNKGGDPVVNARGGTIGAKGSGDTGFGRDENAAVSYAIQQAIAGGAITGLSDRVAKAIKSSTDIDKALKEALSVQNLELSMGGLSAQIDKAFKDFEATAKERVRLATTYGFDLVAIEKKNAEDRVKLAEKLATDQVGSLQKLIEEMTQGSLFEGSALDRITALNTAIAKAKTDLDNGVDGAADTLSNLYQERLSASKDAYGTTSGYAADRTATLDEARAAVARANARIAAAQAAPSDPALATTNAVLTSTAATLDENNDQNAQMIAALREQNALLTRLVNSGAASPGFNLATLASV